jgi:TetR/AcrR family transcriptional regulator
MVRATAEQSRREIVDVATRMFAARSYEATSLSEIAAEWGGSKATVLYHFHTKAAILRDLVQPAVTELRAVLDDADALPAAESRRAVVLGFLTLVINRREALACYPAALRHIVEIPELEDLGIEELGERLVRILSAGADDPLSLVGATVFLNGVLIAAQTHDDLAPEDLRDVLTALAQRILDL